MEYKYKYSAMANINIEEETDELKKEVASVISLPKDKQHDLLYFTAIYVSSGCNLNNAYFLPSELVKASDTIPNKAMDIEHEEEDIVGHIYAHAFTDADGNKMDIKELSSMETASLDKVDIHVQIAGVVYKNRFPELAEEIAAGEWKVSMETYYKNFDVKIGDIIISNKEAQALGLDVADDSLFGKSAILSKDDVEVASGKVVRVLRELLFSGCGFVKTPANPPSVVLETASTRVLDNTNFKVQIITDDNQDKVEKSNHDTIVSDVTNNVTSDYIEDKKDSAELQYNDTVGICVSYKKWVYAGFVMGPDTEILHENWCSLYDKSCTSSSRLATDIDCLRNQVKDIAYDYANKKVGSKATDDNESYLALVAAIDKAAEYL